METDLVNQKLNPPKQSQKNYTAHNILDLYCMVWQQAAALSSGSIIHRPTALDLQIKPRYLSAKMDDQRWRGLAVRASTRWNGLPEKLEMSFTLNVFSYLFMYIYIY